MVHGVLVRMHSHGATMGIGGVEFKPWAFIVSTAVGGERLI